MAGVQATLVEILMLIAVAIASSLFFRAFYNISLHPLSKYPGPWYTSAFSLSGAIISVLRIEPHWLHGLVKKYGTNTPIRISPTMLLFPKPSALKEIYWDPKCNQKSGLYGSGVLGPPHLFTTLDGEYHKGLRKALSNAPWSIGGLKKSWESRIDDQVSLFVRKMNQRAETHEKVCLSDKVAEFAADIMTMLSFTEPWGFVANSRDEHQILMNWRQGLDFFGFVGRFRFFREVIMKIPGFNVWLLPAYSNDTGMGWLISQADKQVTDREAQLSNEICPEKPDFMQHALDARIDGEPLSPVQKRAHVALLIQAGADTTGTALGSTLRFLSTNPEKMSRARQEIEAADIAGELSTPVQYEEVRVHLPYFVACIKESLRLEPPATNLFARVAGKEGKTIDGHFIPPGIEITSNAYVVQRDPTLYAPDPDSFRPERWLESTQKANEYDACSFVFGMGPRVCLGKDIAIMELYKLLPEIIRRFDVEVINQGRYVVAGGVAYNKDFEVTLSARR
ncbi:related to pisatin demethylase / cytochrome P450 monooxygenase [Phialocephala subalpina]|uniref:Related to pisatin demethylase / cytochrome P450 monooxygenase n=1 Tax=Phialocephala subalpina TaxID=576137 RepID=A0A1L7WZS1_9HELO|nr:related to pisatin demethylase / cytochrome P450 monooxygenase [Phialocephala subalpina]